MSTDIKPTEIKVEGIGTQQEKVVAPQETTEVDYEAELAKKNADLAQIKQEKENYRKAYLKLGGNKPVEDDNSDESLDDKVSRLVKEQILNTKEAQAQAEKEALVTTLAKKNKELTLALKNRNQVTQVSALGSNGDKNEVKTDNFFSEAQIAELKKRGYSDKKIESLKSNLKNPTASK